MMEAEITSEILVNINLTTRRNIPEDSHFQEQLAFGAWKNTSHKTDEMTGF
jgi:hypothetical protein